MANKLYPKGKAALLQGLINMASDSIRAMLIDGADYVYDDAHEFLSDVPAAARVSTSANLSGKTFGVNGTFDSDDVVFPGVAGDVVEILLLYQHTGTDATARLIMFQDTGVAGMPLTPDGNNALLTVDAAGWFGL